MVTLFRPSRNFIAVSLTGATNPVSFVAQRVPKISPLGNKKPPRKSKGSEDSSGEASRESEGEKGYKSGKRGEEGERNLKAARPAL